MVRDIPSIRRSDGRPLQTSAGRDLPLFASVRFDRPKICFARRVTGVQDPAVARPPKVKVPAGSGSNLSRMVYILGRTDVDVCQGLQLNGGKRFPVIRHTHSVVAVDITP